MTLKEVYAREYQVKPEHLDARWAEDEQKILEVMKGFPTYDPNALYTPEEVSRLFWMDQERHKAKIKLVESGIQVVDKRVGQRAQSVADFLRKLDVGMSVEMPKNYRPAAFYTAGRNGGIRVSVTKEGDRFVVTRLS